AMGSGVLPSPDNNRISCIGTERPSPELLQIVKATTVCVTLKHERVDHEPLNRYCIGVSKDKLPSFTKPTVFTFGGRRRPKLILYQNSPATVAKSTTSAVVGALANRLRSVGQPIASFLDDALADSL